MVSQWSADVVRGVLGDDGQGHDGAKRRMGARCEDGDGSNQGGWGRLRVSRTDATTA
jgi:hypothetical protein